MTVLSVVLMLLFLQIFFFIMFIPFTRIFASDLEFAFVFYQGFSIIVILLITIGMRARIKKIQPVEFAFDDEGVHLKYPDKEMHELIPWTEIRSVGTSRLLMCFYVNKKSKQKYSICLGPEVSDFDDMFNKLEKYRDTFQFEID